MKLTYRQKHILSCGNPFFNGLSNRKEIKQLKLLARGHYFDEPDWYNYVSFGLNGKRKFFQYDFVSPVSKKISNTWKNNAKMAAYWWAKGQYARAKQIDSDNWDSSRHY